MNAGILNLHSSEYFNTRYMVPGVRKRFVKCRDTIKFSECPYGMTPGTRQAAVISWDALIADGNEPVSADSLERQGNTKKMIGELRDRMDTEDPRLAMALEARAFRDDSVKQISKDLNVSEPRVYQLISHAKKIILEFLDEL